MFCVGLAVLQSCGPVILATSSVVVGIVSLNVSNVTATQTVWTTRMRQHVVSVLHLMVLYCALFGAITEIEI